MRMVKGLENQITPRMERDLLAGKRRAVEELEQVTELILGEIKDRLQDPGKKLKVTFANLTFAYGVLTDKRLALETGPNQTTTNHNTIVINGFSRAEATAFLKGDGVGNGFPNAVRVPATHAPDGQMAVRDRILELSPANA